MKKPILASIEELKTATKTEYLTTHLIFNVPDESWSPKCQELINMISQAEWAAQYSCICKMLIVCGIGSCEFENQSWVLNLAYPTGEHESDCLNGIVFASLLASLVLRKEFKEAISLTHRYMRTSMKFGLGAWLILVRRTIASFANTWPHFLDNEATKSSILLEWESNVEGIFSESMLLSYLIFKRKSKDQIHRAIDSLDKLIKGT